MSNLFIHLRNVRGAKTIIKKLKELDKDLEIREYSGEGGFTAVQSRAENVGHYVIGKSITTKKMCLVVYDRNDHDKTLYIPLSKIDTIFC